MATKVAAPVKEVPLCAFTDHLPSMGVLLSGRLANTTSTYSSCILWREPFNPAERVEKKVEKVEINLRWTGFCMFLLNVCATQDHFGLNKTSAN